MQQMMNIIVSGYCVAARNALQPLPVMKALYRRRDPLLKDVPPVVYKPWPGQFDVEDPTATPSNDSIYTQTLWLPHCLTFLKLAFAHIPSTILEILNMLCDYISILGNLLDECVFVKYSRENLDLGIFI